MSLKMRGEVLDEVIKRLRSGDYRQGRNTLRQRSEDGDRYCCLGVICEIAVEEGVINRTDMGGWYSYGPEGVYDAMYLPEKVVDWAWIVSDVEKEWSGDYYYEQRGQYGENGLDALAVMNDDGVPFSDIADWMEANVVRV